MADETRISTVPAAFNSYMLRTNTLQRTVITPPNILKYTTLGWTSDESDDWNDFTERSVIAFAIYDDPDKTGPGPRKIMKALIAEVRKYDNDSESGHHLLDLVAVHGTLDDCIAFNVKKGTVLAVSTTHRSNIPEKKMPKISLKSNEQSQQVIICVNPETPKSKKLPEGVLAAMMYRFVGTTKPDKLSEYAYIGISKRGEIVSKIEDPGLESDTKIYAWYYSRYLYKDGSLSEASSILKVEVLLPTA